MGKLVTLVALVLDTKSLIEKLLLVPLVTLVIKIRDQVKKCHFGCFGHGKEKPLKITLAALVNLVIKIRGHGKTCHIGCSGYGHKEPP